MKIKTPLITGIFSSVALIITVIIFMVMVSEARRDYRREQDRNRDYGYYSPAKERLSSYAKMTRIGGYLTVPFVLSVLSASLLLIKRVKAVKWIMIFNYAIILFSVLLIAFTLTGVSTTTGGITFDEIGALWVVYAVINIIYSVLALIKAPKQTAMAA